MKRQFLLGIAFGLMALAAPAMADVNITFLGRDSNMAQVQVVQGAQAIGTGFLDYAIGTSSGPSFEAFCLDPTVSNSRKGLTTAYQTSSFSGNEAQLMEGLFSSSYSSVNNYATQAAFQLAVWEIASNYKPGATPGPLNLSTGSFTVISGGTYVDPATNISYDLVSMANSYLSSAQAYTGPSLYTLTQLTSNKGFQPLVTIQPVPEPSQLTLLVAGLALIGVVKLRRGRR